MLCQRARVRPDLAKSPKKPETLGATRAFEIDDRAIIVEGLDEPPRHSLQHGYGYQCHDRAKPHHHRQHGRAPIGGKAENGTPTP